MRISLVSKKIILAILARKSLIFFSFFGQGYQWWKFLFFLFVIFGQGYQWWVLLFLGHFWPRIPMVKLLLGHFWPRLLSLATSAMNTNDESYVCDLSKPLASRPAKREFAFAGGNLWHPTVQAGVRAPGATAGMGLQVQALAWKYRVSRTPEWNVLRVTN